MFGYMNVRYKVTLVWLLSFITLWTTLHLILPKKIIASQLNKIEQSVKVKDWKKANEDMNILKSAYKKNRIFIQMNNSTEVFTTFEYTLGQLETTVKHNKDAAIEYIGALKESLNLVVKPFSGP